MWTLHETDNENTVPCEVIRMTRDEIAAARFSWCCEFQLRRRGSAHDADALIWTGGFMSSASSGDGSYLNGYVIKAAGDIQGIVVIDEDLRESKLQPTAAIAYVLPGHDS